MGFLKDISSFVSDLLGGGQKGQTFGDIDLAAAERPAVTPTKPSRPQAAVDMEVEETPEFSLALELVKQRAPFVFVTGRAGTGKTTFIRWMRSRIGGNIAVVAPTGLAALAAGGQTTNSFFRIPPRFMPLDEVKQLRNRAVYEHLDLIVIDEVSMVRADTMDVIDRFMRLNGPKSNQPFGGVPVLAVGDLHQLPPIVAERELDASAHWVLDVTFNEDRCRCRKDHSDVNFALMRRLAMNLLRANRDRTKLSMKAQRLKIGWDIDFLEDLLSQLN